VNHIQKSIQETLKELNHLNQKQGWLITKYSSVEQEISNLSHAVFHLEKKIKDLQKKVSLDPSVNVKKLEELLEAIRKKIDSASLENESLNQVLQDLENNESQLIENEFELQKVKLEENHAMHLDRIQEQINSMILKGRDIRNKSNEACAIGVTLHEKMGLFKQNVTELNQRSEVIDTELQETYQSICQRYALATDKDVLAYTLRYATNFQLLHGTYWRMALIAIEEKNLFKAYQYLSFMNKSFSRAYESNDLLEDVQKQLLAYFQFENLSPINFYRKAKQFKDQPDIVIALCILSISIDKEHRFHLGPYRLLVETLIEKDAWFEADIFLNRILNFDDFSDKRKFMETVIRNIINQGKSKNTESKVPSCLFIQDNSNVTKEELEAFQIEMIELFKSKIMACQDDLLVQKIFQTRFYQQFYADLCRVEKKPTLSHTLIEYINSFKISQQNQDILNDFPQESSYLKAWVHYLHQDFEQVLHEIPYFKEIPLSEMPNIRPGAGL
jgi:predicted  nucleic acid-binding Zn-ribbon protein